MQLKAYLEAEKLSQSEFARQLGVTQGLIWQWLNGHRRVSAEKVLKIDRLTGGKVTGRDLRPDLYPRESHKPEARASA